MLRYEFKVIPAPRRGEKARGVKTTEDRFAYAMTRLMNELGREGWDYVRADTLPVDERSGLTGTKTSYQNLLVFRRPLTDVALAQADADRLAVPADQAPVASKPPAVIRPTDPPANDAVFFRRLGPADTPAEGSPPSLLAVPKSKPAAE